MDTGYLTSRLKSRRVVSIAMIAAVVLVIALFHVDIPRHALAQSADDMAAPAEDFEAWLEAFREDALAAGISDSTFDRALKGVTPLLEVLERDRRQPEFSLTLDGYLSRAISEARIAKGRRLLKKHQKLLAEVAARYGVQPRFLVAFWGLESNFGGYTGGFPVIAALATLAHDPRRSDFFRKQLLHALRILEEGHISAADMTGSWAGAMGQLQFMPTTFTGYAIDFDGDQRRDIWRRLPDIFASAANYLAASGWRGDETWGREVRLPVNFDWTLAGRGRRKALQEWQDLGVRRADGRALPKADIEGAIILPAGHLGPAFIVYRNFRATLAWNNSTLYAIAVGLLADRLAWLGGLQTKPGFREEPLRRRDIMEIQERLTREGFDPGPADGLAGRQTRAALRLFQQSRGLPADGYSSSQILEVLRQEAGEDAN